MPCFAASFREASSRTAAIANRRASAQRLSCRMLPLRASSLHGADHLERPGGSAGASACPGPHISRLTPSPKENSSGHRLRGQLSPRFPSGRSPSQRPTVLTVLTQTPPLQGDIAAGRDLWRVTPSSPAQFDGPQGRSRLAEVLEAVGAANAGTAGSPLADEQEPQCDHAGTRAQRDRVGRSECAGARCRPASGTDVPAGIGH